MKRVLLTAAVLILATVCVSQTTSQNPSAPAKVAAPVNDEVLGPAGYQEMLNKYCITCHNEKAKIPAGAPLFLDKANLKDPGADAAVWEKVVRKLGVGAMPPQNSPTPGTDQLTAFRSALITSLDSAAAAKNYPGRYVLHRLNRTEYANSVRDLLGVKVDVAELLPSDGGDFGFDNIATALTTSP
jgi:mono/diheme cytochrome c family protein